MHDRIQFVFNKLIRPGHITEERAEKHRLFFLKKGCYYLISQRPLNLYTSTKEGLCHIYDVISIIKYDVTSTQYR